MKGVGFFDEFGFGFVVKNGVEEVGAVDVDEILRANVRVGDYLKNGMSLLDENVAGFVVEGDDGLGDVFEVVDEGLFDGVGEGKFVAGTGVDEIFDIFKERVASDELTNFFSEDNFTPFVGGDKVGGIKEP